MPPRTARPMAQPRTMAIITSALAIAEAAPEPSRTAAAMRTRTRRLPPPPPPVCQVPRVIAGSPVGCYLAADPVHGAPAEPLAALQALAQRALRRPAAAALAAQVALPAIPPTLRRGRGGSGT